MSKEQVVMTVIGAEGIGQRELRMKLEGCDGREEQARYIVGTSDSDAHSYDIYITDANLPLGPPLLYNPDDPHNYHDSQGTDISPFSFWLFFQQSPYIPQLIVLAYSATDRQTFLDLKDSYDQTIKRIAHARTAQSSRIREGGKRWLGPVHIIIAGFSTYDGRQSRGIQVSREEVRGFANMKMEQHKGEREERWIDIEVEHLKEVAQRDAKMEEEKWGREKRERERSDRYERYWEENEEDMVKELSKRCRQYLIKTLGGKWGGEKVKREREEEEKKYSEDFSAWMEYRDKKCEEEKRREKERFEKLKEEHLRRRREGKMEEHDILPTDPEYKVPIVSVPMLVKGTEVDVDDWDDVDRFMKDIVLDMHASWTTVGFPMQMERQTRRTKWEEEEKRKEREANTLKRRVKSLVERVKKGFRGEDEEEDWEPEVLSFNDFRSRK